MDYLLKPFSKARFSSAVSKAADLFKWSQESKSDVDRLLETIDDNKEMITRIAVKAGGKINIIPASDIIFLESYGDYVKIHAKTGIFVKEKTMKYFENHLEPNKFVRIHRSYIINSDEITRLELYGKDSYIAIMKNNNKLAISDSGYKLLKQKLNW